MTASSSTADGSLPAHASPAFPPLYSPPNSRPQQLDEYGVSDLQLNGARAKSPNHDTFAAPTSAPYNTATTHALSTSSLPADSSAAADAESRPPPPPSLLSPAVTPPVTPGETTSAHTNLLHPSPSAPSDTTAELPHQHSLRQRRPSKPRPRLLETLPEVNCVVRARIPTTTGQEMFLHLYTNNVDGKEHLAIVFGGNIRSRSLDAERPGETELDRMIRGAYVGTLYPGRTSSRTGEGSSAAVGQRQQQGEYDDDAAQAVREQEVQERQAPLVRIHSECYTGETVWSARCDCGEQLDEAARLMSLPSAASSGGVIVYLRQEGRGIGLSEKLKAYNLQDLGSDTYEANLLLRHPADARSYGLATAMLLDLGLGGDQGIRLLTNNPDKVSAVEGPNREVVVKERVPMVPLAWRTGGKEGIKSQEVERYLSTKIEKFKHMLNAA
ncbi:GTP cyclohydrolase II-domain-containing protein [Lineolata rhizophorae]|uniref:GTP cyclohydrolase II n=1 Tax=Lineolata rhizophorae TaxID=578093 RepID=A0A6A6PE50_9PEZI|nr:GTP cyclohydrolase II-domain-containing protein [Lineolata rhizophorae]